MTRITELQKLGQSLWLDNIDRRLLIGDGLSQLIELGISGVTSNPAIFQKALAGSDAYDEEIASLLEMNPAMPVESIYEWLTVRDVQMAADLLGPVHERSAGLDGYVSLEVSPHLAYDTEATLAAARHLWQSVKRPNLMIKVPATLAGLPAMAQLIAEGVNVNATLLFSVERYQAVAEAYLQGLARCPTPERVASVASFFVSRIDSKVDRLLEASVAPEAIALRGRVAIAQARCAYQRYKQVVPPGLAGLPARYRSHPQRLLWASTSTKNPAYMDVIYVDNLIGPDTVNTVPPETLDAFVYHGTVRLTLESDTAEAEGTLQTLAELGVDIEAISEELEREGVEKFMASYDAGLASLREKLPHMV